MDRRGGAVIWKLLDPILIKIARRLEHLALHHPSDYMERVTRSRGRFSPKAIVTPRGRVQSVAAPDHLEVGDYSHIEGEIFLLTPESRCRLDRKSTRLNSSHLVISYAVFCLKK